LEDGKIEFSCSSGAEIILSPIASRPFLRPAQSSVNVCRDYATDLDNRGSIPDGERDFSVLYSVQIDYGAHPASIQWVPGAFFLGVKRPEHETDHSPPSSAEVNNSEGILSFPHTTSWHSASVLN
jgi:hypothetical protein